MPQGSAIKAILGRERGIVLALLAFICIWSWLFLLDGAGMGDMSGMMGMGAATPPDTTTLFWMWWVMMIAMMLPSASPLILSYQTLLSRSSASAEAGLQTLVLAASYLVTWALFSGLAVSLQYLLEGRGLLDGMMRSTSATLSGILLLLAGMYQFTPIKEACLRYCRSPLVWLSDNWRPRLSGALVMGFRHGLYCLGCCWFLMALLFVGGVMNLLWIAGLAVWVLIEKVAPHGQLTSRIAGIALSLWGLWILLA